MIYYKFLIIIKNSLTSIIKNSLVNMLKIETSDGYIIEYPEETLKKNCRNIVTSLPFKKWDLNNFLNYVSSDSVYFHSDNINDLISFAKIADYLDYHENLESFRINHIATMVDIIKWNELGIKFENVTGEPRWADLVKELENLQ